MKQEIAFDPHVLLTLSHCQNVVDLNLSQCRTPLLTAFIAKNVIAVEAVSTNFTILTTKRETIFTCDMHHTLRIFLDVFNQPS